MKSLLASLFLLIITVTANPASAQDDQRYIRLATIVVDSGKLDSYKAALKEEIETSVQVEPGVLVLNAVYSIGQPTHVTVFEVYATKAAYESHIKTPHFLRYKELTKDMVKSLVLTDVRPIAMPDKK